MADEKKAPAFQFYPRDFLTDEKVVLMSNTEIGIYMRLLSYCWLENTLPMETAALARFAKMPIKQFTKLWENSVVRTCFHVEDDGRLHHKRLDIERAKQGRFSRRQSDNAASRWHRSGNAVAVPNACPRVAESKLQTVLPEKESEEKPPEEPIEARAGRLLESYAGWYQRFRHGARLRLLRNALEFGEACQLCELWDDARLEKLAQIVLTTNDEFIAGTDRSFKIFALKASWADDRLRAAESGAA